jgi:hypothetical protein
VIEIEAAPINIFSIEASHELYSMIDDHPSGYVLERKLDTRTKGNHRKYVEPRFSMPMGAFNRKEIQCLLGVHRTRTISQNFKMALIRHYMKRRKGTTYTGRQGNA